MAWREHSMREERAEFVRLALQAGANKSELSRRFGVSRSNAYKWLQRYVAEGEAGLAERSRQPDTSPGQTREAMEAAVLEVRARSNGVWGGRKIAVTVEAAGASQPSRCSTLRIFRPPQAGCSARTASTAASSSRDVRPGLDSGRRERSCSPGGPSASKRLSHL